MIAGRKVIHLAVFCNLRLRLIKSYLGLHFYVK